MLLLALAAVAHALTSHRSAVGLDLGAGLGVGAGLGRAAPVAPALGVQSGFGFYRGQFDDQFSFGRYWWLGPTAQLDVHPGEGVVARPLLDVRRGVDLLVAGFTYGLVGGLVLRPDAPVGATVRATGSARFRRSRTFSLALRADAGVDVLRGRPSFGGGLTLGVFLGAPLRRSPGDDAGR